MQPEFLVKQIYVSKSTVLLQITSWTLHSPISRSTKDFEISSLTSVSTYRWPLEGDRVVFSISQMNWCTMQQSEIIRYSIPTVISIFDDIAVIDRTTITIEPVIPHEEYTWANGRTLHICFISGSHLISTRLSKKFHRCSVKTSSIIVWLTCAVAHLHRIDICIGVVHVLYVEQCA